MPIWMPRFRREIVIRHNISADEAFEREGGEHVQTKAKSSDVGHEIIRRKIIEDVALRLVSEGEKTRKSHCQTGDHGNSSREMGDRGKAVDGRSLKRSVDE